MAHCLQRQAAAQGDRLLAAFTLQLEADQDATSFQLIYTMGQVVDGELQPHDVRSVRAPDMTFLVVHVCCRFLSGGHVPTPMMLYSFASFHAVLLQSHNGNTVELDLTDSVADIVVHPISSGAASSHRNLSLARVWTSCMSLLCTCHHHVQFKLGKP